MLVVAFPICRQAIPCGSSVQLLHHATNKYLKSSSEFQSPLTGQQEICCVDDQKDIDTLWKVECAHALDNFVRNQPIKLRHVSTDRYLSANKAVAYRAPVNGQLEVFASSPSDKSAKDIVWTAAEGLYFE